MLTVCYSVYKGKKNQKKKNQKCQPQGNNWMYVSLVDEFLKM